MLSKIEILRLDEVRLQYKKNKIKKRRGEEKKRRRCDVVPQGKMRSPNEEERRLSIHIV